MHGRDQHGASSPPRCRVAKLPYDDAQDGISLTDSVVPVGLWARPREERVDNLVGVLDGYVDSRRLPHERQRARPRDALDAMDHPEQYPQLTIRVSGYAVNFVRLTREQQHDVINRTFHAGAVTARRRDHAARRSIADRRRPLVGPLHGVDGPGTRFVLFLAGCPLRCLYCQNPDTWRSADGRVESVDE